MILGIDHIACSVPENEFENVKQNFLNAGYSVFLEETGLENLLIKKDFMTDYKSVHDLILMKKNGCIPVEILNHGSSSRKTGLFEVVADNSINYKSMDKAGSLRFWEQFGFAGEPDCGKVKYRSFFSSLEISFEESTEKRYSCLDDVNYNCVALMTTSVVEEYAKLKDLCKCSDIAELKVGGRNLKIFFARNISGGEIVEIFEIARS